MHISTGYEYMLRFWLLFIWYSILYINQLPAITSFIQWHFEQFRFLMWNWTIRKVPGPRVGLQIFLWESFWNYEKQQQQNNNFFPPSIFFLNFFFFFNAEFLQKFQRIFKCPKKIKIYFSKISNGSSHNNNNTIWRTIWTRLKIDTSLAVYYCYFINETRTHTSIDFGILWWSLKFLMIEIMIIRSSCFF